MTQPSFDFDRKPVFSGPRFGPARDAAPSVKAKDDGMALAAKNRAELLDIARAIARHLATTVHADRCVDAEDVAYVLSQRGSPSLGNAAGSLFRNRKEWRFTGRWRNSTRVTSHARTIRIWEFIGA